MPRKPTVLVFYHFLYPDDVVSALHFSDLCQGLAERGWQVTARPSNRGCREEDRTYSACEDWDGVLIRRVQRPPFRQSSVAGRVANLVWMLGAWSIDAIRMKPAPDVLIIGTDPVLSVLVAIVWKAFKPQTKIVHWCFDLYPEAAFADGLLKRSSFIGRTLRVLMRRAYRCCDLVADIGSCMRAQLAEYGSKARQVTLVPWAIAEPEQPLAVVEDERAAVFGSTSLGIMYSGTYGRAHTCSDLLALSRSLLNTDAILAFSIRGNRVDDLRGAVRPEDSNIRFVPFAASEKLQERLAAADIHIVSLREDWTGTVVPSKFFGALAIGRPVLFFGSRESSLAKIIEQHRVGWVWDRENSVAIAESICHLATDARALAELARHCHSVYRMHFSRTSLLARWDQELRQLLNSESSQPAGSDDADCTVNAAA